MQRINRIWAKKGGSQIDILGVGVDLNLLICVPQQTAASQSVVVVVVVDVVVVVFRALLSVLVSRVRDQSSLPGDEQLSEGVERVCNSYAEC